MRVLGSVLIYLLVALLKYLVFRQKKSRAAVGWLTFYRMSNTIHFYGIPVYHEQSTVYRAFSHNVTAAILMFQNNQTAAILLFHVNSFLMKTFSFGQIHLPLILVFPGGFTSTNFSQKSGSFLDY